MRQQQATRAYDPVEAIASTFPVIYELRLDEDLWKLQKSIRDRFNVGKPANEDCLMLQADGKVFRFYPGETYKVPETIARILIENSKVFPSVKNRDGKPMLEHDKMGRRLPQLITVDKYRADKGAVPSERVAIGASRCPFCQKEFAHGADDAFRSHIETHMKERNSSIGEAARMAEVAAGAGQPEESEDEQDQ